MSKNTEEKYYQMVDESSSEVMDRWISNSIIQHKVYLTNRLFDFADKSIKIFSGKLSLQEEDKKSKDKKNKFIEIYQNKKILNSLCEFLKKPNTELSIILDKEIDGDDVNNHPLIKKIENINKDIKGKFSLSQLKERKSLDNELKKTLHRCG